MSQHSEALLEEISDTLKEILHNLQNLNLAKLEVKAPVPNTVAELQRRCICYQESPFPCPVHGTAIR